MTEPARHGLLQQTRHLAVVRPDLRSPLRRALDDTTWLREHVIGLTEQVGGIDALETLDATPAPLDAAFAWEALPYDVGRLLDDSVALADDGCRALLDSEYGALTRRLLTRAVVAGPRLRDVEAERLAAAAVWVIAGGNGRFGRDRRALKARDVWAWFGVPASTELGRRLRRAVGLDDDASRMPDPSLLHSATRRRFIDERDRVEAFVAAQLEARAQSRPIDVSDDGRYSWRDYSIPLWCRDVQLANGNRGIELGIRALSGAVEVVLLSSTTAIDLRYSLEAAISAPC